MGYPKYKGHMTRPEVKSSNSIDNFKYSKADKSPDNLKCSPKSGKTAMHLRNNSPVESRENNETNLYASQPLSVHSDEHLNVNSCCSSDISVASGSPGVVFSGGDVAVNNQKSNVVGDTTTGKINEVVNSLMRIVKMQQTYLKFQSTQNKSQRHNTALVSRTVTEILDKVKPETTNNSIPFKEQNAHTNVTPKKLSVRPRKTKRRKLPTSNRSREIIVTDSYDDQPPIKRKRKGGPMACLNEPSIHDRLNLWILPTATRIAASEALDLCAIRTQMIEPRRRRAPVDTYTPDLSSIPKQIKRSINIIHASKKCQSRVNASEVRQTCCIPVASNLTIPPSISSNSPYQTSSSHVNKSSTCTNNSSTKSHVLRLHPKPKQNDAFEYSVSKMKCSSASEDLHFCDDPPLLITDKTYYLPDFLLEDEREEAMKFTRGEKNVEVPYWRVVDLSKAADQSKTVTKRSGKKLNRHIAEPPDIELLEDEVFLKRHSKGEQGEIRRDKRERQRLKELAQREKWEAKQRALQSKLKLITLGVSEVNQPSLPNTLAGDTDKSKVPITVRDSIHVIAFGSAIPAIRRQQFTLPWLSNGGRS